MPLPGDQHQVSKQTQERSGWSAPQARLIQDRLGHCLGPEFLSYRPSPGGGKVAFIEAWRVINLANDAFGFNGWSSEIRDIHIDYSDEMPNGRFSLGVSATVRVTLKDGTFHEDVGFGHMENIKSKYVGFDKCKKEATTDGLKRTLRKFGNLLGNCIYNPVYTRQLARMSNSPQVFDRNSLVSETNFQTTYHKNFSHQNQSGTAQDIPSSPDMPAAAAKQEPQKQSEYVHKVPKPVTTNPTVQPVQQRRPESTVIVDPDSEYKIVQPAEDNYDSVNFDDLMTDEFDEDEIKALAETLDKPPEIKVYNPSNAVSKSQQKNSLQNINSNPVGSYSTPPPKGPNDEEAVNLKTPIGFYKASAAQDIQQNSPVPSTLLYNPASVNPAIRGTLDQSKSMPVRKADVSDQSPNSSKSPVIPTAKGLESLSQHSTQNGNNNGPSNTGTNQSPNAVTNSSMNGNGNTMAKSSNTGFIAPKTFGAPKRPLPRGYTPAPNKKVLIDQNTNENSGNKKVV